jgi:hypothetical protein
MVTFQLSAGAYIYIYHLPTTYFPSQDFKTRPKTTSTLQHHASDPDNSPSYTILPHPSPWAVRTEEHYTRWGAFANSAAALDRISQIGSQLSGQQSAGGREKLFEKNPDDVRII